MTPALLLLSFGCTLAALAAVVFCVQQVWHPVGFIPTPPDVTAEMVRMARLSRGLRVIDLGCGDGRLLVAAKASCPGIAAEGWEASLIPWVLGRWKTRRLRGVRLRLGNLWKADVREADVIFVYLWPSMMERLSHTLKQQAKPGCLVISHAFALPGYEAVEERVVLSGGRDRTIRGYRIRPTSAE